MPRRTTVQSTAAEHRAMARQVALITETLWQLQEMLGARYGYRSALTKGVLKLVSSLNHKGIAMVRCRLDDLYYAEGHTGYSPYYDAQAREEPGAPGAGDTR